MSNSADDLVESQTPAAEFWPKEAPVDRAELGPFDAAEAQAVRPYIDLGGLKILPREGLNMRLEVEENSGRVVAVSLDYAGSTLQVQPFAAPRGSGLWHETRTQIQQQVGAGATEQTGSLGIELLAEVRALDAQGQPAKRAARFVGVDGPRWFLRGVIGGPAATDASAAAEIDDLFRSIVVVRGTNPMPPRDLIALQVPAALGS